MVNELEDTIISFSQLCLCSSLVFLYVLLSSSSSGSSHVVLQLTSELLLHLTFVLIYWVQSRKWSQSLFKLKTWSLVFLLSQPTHPPTHTGDKHMAKKFRLKKGKEKERNGFRQPARVSVWQNRAEERVTESMRVKGLTVESRGSQGGTDSEGREGKWEKETLHMPWLWFIP